MSGALEWGDLEDSFKYGMGNYCAVFASREANNPRVVVCWIKVFFLDFINNRSPAFINREAIDGPLEIFFNIACVIQRFLAIVWLKKG